MNSFLSQATASQIRAIGPIMLVDGVTIYAGAVANTDIKLMKNGAAFVNKNSGGGTSRGNGEYAVTWDATDTDTVGELKYSVLISGCLPHSGTYQVQVAVVYDALHGASATGFMDATAVAAAVLNAVASTYNTALTIGNKINAAASAGDPWVTPLPGAYGAGTAGKIIGDNVNATISSRATPAQVNTEMLDALTVDTYAEPGQLTPPSTASIKDKIGYLHKKERNKNTQTATEGKLYTAGGATVDQKWTVSDDGTTFTKGEAGSGP